MKQTFFLLFFMLTLTSCNRYKEVSVKESVIADLNNKLSAAQNNGEPWAASPEEIARHFFPAISHDSGTTLYQVRKNIIDPKNCEVTILEEGPIDDEVEGERRTIRFQSVDDRWKLLWMKHSIKRRD